VDLVIYFAFPPEQELFVRV